MNESTVLLASNLAWPVTVLIITFMLLASQRQPIGKLIDRIKFLKYPGGEAQLDIAVPETGADTIQALVDSLSRDLSERTERDEPALAGAGTAAVTAHSEPGAARRLRATSDRGGHQPGDAPRQR